MFLEMELSLRTGRNSCMLAAIMPAFTPHEFVSKWKRAEVDPGALHRSMAAGAPCRVFKAWHFS
jgi:hypothetical protein